MWCNCINNSWHAIGSLMDILFESLQYWMGICSERPAGEETHKQPLTFVQRNCLIYIVMATDCFFILLLLNLQLLWSWQRQERKRKPSCRQKMNVFTDSIKVNWAEGREQKNRVIWIPPHHSMCFWMMIWLCAMILASHSLINIFGCVALVVKFAVRAPLLEYLHYTGKKNVHEMNTSVFSVINFGKWKFLVFLPEFECAPHRIHRCAVSKSINSKSRVARL